MEGYALVNMESDPFHEVKEEVSQQVCPFFVFVCVSFGVSILNKEKKEKKASCCCGYGPPSL